jgi:hypothetical protein
MDALTLTGDTLVVAIRAEHEAASQAARSALEHALACGRLLAQARATVPHGGWETFVEKTCGIAPRTGRLYLRLHANRDRLGNRQRVAGLTVREAAKLVAEPRRERSTPDAGAPSWYVTGRILEGVHDDGWLVEVWPHPGGEAWAHFVVAVPGVDGPSHLEGPKRGIRVDRLRAVMATTYHLPDVDGPGWTWESRPVNEGDAGLVNSHHNAQLYASQAEYAALELR